MLNGIGGHTTVYIHSYSGLTFPPWLTEGRTNNTSTYEKILGCLEPIQNFIWFLTVSSTD